MIQIGSVELELRELSATFTMCTLDGVGDAAGAEADAEGDALGEGDGECDAVVGDGAAACAEDEWVVRAAGALVCAVVPPEPLLPPDP